MPQRNQNDQPVGVIGGDSGSTNTPYHGPFRGVPDVSFGDTTEPVFSVRYDVPATWNMPVVSFSLANIRSSFQDANGKTGAITILSSAGSATALVSIDFPLNSYGKLRVEVIPKTVISAVDNRTLGPPDIRAFEVEYDTRPDLPLPDRTPATLKLSKPAHSTWRQASYFQGFLFSKNVEGFTEEDVNVEVAGLGTAVLSNFRPSENDNSLYTADINLTGSGTIIIKVEENIAKSGGSEDDNSPPSAVQESWAFDATPVNFNPVNADGTTANIEILHTETLDNTSPKDSFSSGSFLGASDAIVYNNKLFFTSQIQQKKTSSNELSTYLPSRGALVSLDLSTRTLTTHKSYAFFRQAARSMVVHRGELHFFEGSAYIFDGSAQPNFTLLNVGKDLGVVRKIDTGNNITSLGRNWRSGFPTGPKDRYDGIHGGTFSPMISHNDDLHIISQKFDFFDIHGVQWIVYGKKLNQRISLLETNGKTGFEIIEELARLNNSIIGISQGRFVFKPRSPNKAFLKADISEVDNSITLKNPNRILFWTNTGYVLIENELISYSGTGLDSGGDIILTGLDRGLEGTVASTHDADAPIVLINHVINAMALERPVNEMDININSNNIKNNITTKYSFGEVPRSEYLSFTTSDAESILEHGNKKDDLELSLDYHQHQWAILISNDFIRRYKNEQKTITLTLKRNFVLELADTVYLTEPVISLESGLFQIMSISHNKKSEETNVIVASLTL